MASVVHKPDQLPRYEIHVDDAVAGFTQYRSMPGIVDFIHTEIDDAHEGQPVASSPTAPSTTSTPTASR